MNKNHKRISAAVLSLALGFSIAGAPILAPVAGAQITADDLSSVDLDADVTLNINKYAGEIGDITTPLDNVVFTVEKVDIGTADLNTFAGWEAVNAIQTAFDGGTAPTLVPGDEWELITAGGTASITTGTTGAVTENFTVGLYLVTETQSGNYSVAKPFLVALPFTDPDSGEWNYTQSVSPKNQELSVEKNVSDNGATLNSNVDYTINASVPAGAMDRFNIIDTLPAELDLNGTVTPTVTAPGTTLVEGTDYTLSTIGDVITVEFQEPGLTKLEAARLADPSLQVSVQFSATVVALPVDGIIRNDVVVELPNDGRITTDPNDPDNPGDPEDGAETRLGRLTINKQDEAGNPILIDGTDVTRGATFELWRCNLDAGNWTVSGTALSAVVDVAGTDTVVSEFTTDASGSASVEGVQVANWVNNNAPSASVPPIDEDLCVVETVAPNGYTLNPEPQHVDLVTVGDDYDMVVDVTNLDETIAGQLPATGGQGTLAMIAAGVVVAAAGGAAAVRGNRARK